MEDLITNKENIDSKESPMPKQESELPKCPYYVTMTDKFLSGWGMAKGQTNKVVFCAKTYEDAKIVETNAKDRTDMKNVSIRSTKPYYNPRSYLTSAKTEKDAKTWYRSDRPFKKKNR